MNHLPKYYNTLYYNCVSVNNNLSGKLVSSLELLIKFHERFQVTSVPNFLADPNYLCCELDNFIFNVILSNLILILNKNEVKS